MSYYATSPQSTNAVFKESFKLYKRSFGQVWFWALLAILANLLSALHPMINMHTSIVTANQPAKIAFSFSWSGFGVFVVMTLVTLFFYNVIFYRVHTIAADLNANTLTAFSVAIRKLLLTLVTGIIVTILICIGLVLFILPGIFIAIALVMCIPAIIIDNESIIGSMRKSMKLVLGNWWRTFVLLLVPTLIVLLLNILVLIIFGKANYLAQGITNVLYSTIIIPWFVAILLTQFNNLKLIKKL